MTAFDSTNPSSEPALDPRAALGREILCARVSERCEGCGAERARGSEGGCRCTQPNWRNFCTRCLKRIDEDICPHCLAVAEANGRKLKGVLDSQLAREGTIAGVGAAHARIRTRAQSTLREFGIESAAAPLPEWAARIADKNIALPPGAEHSKPKMAAVNELRLEDAGVRLALTNLGYTGRPTDEKLVKTLALAEDALAIIASWDGLATGADHELRLRTAADTLAANLAAAGTLIETLRRRDLSRLVEASVRRARALRNCQSVLGIA